MSGIPHDTAAATSARRTEPEQGTARSKDDVAEARFDYAALLQDAWWDVGGWRRRAGRPALWALALAISVAANWEVLSFLGNRRLEDTDAGAATPAAILVDLPAVERASEEPTAPPSTVQTPTPAEDAPSAPVDVPQAGVPAEPGEPEPTTIPFSPTIPLASAVVPLPVPRPRPPPLRAVARGTAVAKTKRATTSSHRVLAEGPLRDTRRTTASAFVGVGPSTDIWKSEVVAALNRAKRYPDGATAIGSPTLRMMVASSGDVARVAVVASSGSSVLDAAAIDTVHRISPLPPPPGGATGLTFRMNFLIRTR